MARFCCGRRLRRAGSVAGAGLGGRPGCASAHARLELLQPVGGRLAREVGAGPRHLHERQLEREPRVAALPDVVHRDVEEVDQAQHLGLGELVGLRAEAVARLRSHREGVGHLAHVLDEEQVTQVLEQVVDEPREVLSLVGELLDEGKEAGRVAVDDQVAEAEERLLVDRPEKLEDGLDGDLAVGRGRELVERRDRVAEAPTRAAGDQRERGVRGLDLLPVGDQAQELRQLGEAGPREEERLAARAHRGEDLVELGRAEDEDEVRRRLLDQLQERVPGGIRQLVRLVEDVDLEAALDRLEDDVVADLADVVDPALAGGVHLDDVQRDAVGDRHAGVAGLVGVGVGPCSQLSALARIRASDVFPVPRGPAKR